jgi:hypothetical protein
MKRGLINAFVAKNNSRYSYINPTFSICAYVHPSAGMEC